MNGRVPSAAGAGQTNCTSGTGTRKRANAITAASIAGSASADIRATATSPSASSSKHVSWENPPANGLVRTTSLPSADPMTPISVAFTRRVCRCHRTSRPDSRADPAEHPGRGLSATSRRRPYVGTRCGGCCQACLDRRVKPARANVRMLGESGAAVAVAATHPRVAACCNLWCTNTV